MKKLLSIALILTMLLVLVSCSTEKAAEPAKPDETKAEQPAKEDPPVQEEEPEAEPEEEPDPEPIKDEASIGTRKNPMTFDEDLIVTAEYGGEVIEFVMSLSDFVRGEEAHQRMINDNQFNEVSENEEPIYFTVTFNLVTYAPEDDEPYYISSYDFDYYKSDYGEYRTDNYIVVNNELGGSIYEGATASGTVGLVVPKDDEGYILFEDYFWFKVPTE